MSKDHFNIGDIVTLKSHPLFKKNKDNFFSKQLPPLMLIKEVYFENEKKRIYSENIEGAIIANRIKYCCVYYDDKKTNFVESFIYHPILEDVRMLNFPRKKDRNGNVTESDIKLIDELDEYKTVKYDYGISVMLKTSKLESRTPEKIKRYVAPDLQLSGIKINEEKSLFHEDGQPKKLVADELFKVLWHNDFEQKFSEIYLPSIFFVQALDQKVRIAIKK